MRVVVPFDKVIELLEEYKNEHGDLLVPAKYCIANGIKLGSIVSNIRTGARKTTVEEKAKLDELGFVWSCKISFVEVIELLEEYKNEHGDLLVPAKYCIANGIKLGSIVSNIRTGARKTTVEEKAKLDELGFVWSCKISFVEVIELLEEYKNEHGDLLVPAKYCIANGIKLGSIVDTIRTGARKTTAEEKAKLDELGFVWSCQVPIPEVIELLKEYKNEHGNLLVPARYCTANGIKLGSIVSDIRRGGRKTTSEEKAKLDELGFVWKVR